MDAPMRQVVFFPDLQTIVRNALLEQLPPFHAVEIPDGAGAVFDTEGLDVLSERPNPMPDRFLWIGRNGGLEVEATPIIEDPRLDVEMWGSSETDAHDHFQLARGVILALVNVGPIRSVRGFAGPAWAPDPSRRPRYRGSFEFRMRGRVIR